MFHSKNARYIDPDVKTIANRVIEASDILGTIKFPAALFAGASLGQLNVGEHVGVAPRLRFMYNLFISLAFSLQVMSVFCATVLNWRLKGGDFDPNEYSAANLVMKYFEIEYVSVIFFFFSGLMAFFVANTLRSFISFGRANESLFCCILNGLCTFCLLNILDRAFIHFDTFFHVGGRFFYLIGKEIYNTRINLRLVTYILVTIGLHFFSAYRADDVIKMCTGAISSCAKSISKS
jgi:hypothetical protein